MYSIDQFMRLRVAENPDQENLNKTISAVELESFDDRSITCQLVFGLPADITADISEPDVLDLEILKPELIVDAETLDYLPFDRVSHSVALEP